MEPNYDLIYAVIAAMLTAGLDEFIRRSPSKANGMLHGIQIILKNFNRR
jgi:hypothetical protein